MNRFVIVEGLPYLYANGKTYAVRWDDKGFTVGAEVKLTSAPSPVYSELSIFAKCKILDSIKAQPGKAQEQPGKAQEQPGKAQEQPKKVAVNRKKSVDTE